MTKITSESKQNDANKLDDMHTYSFSGVGYSIHVNPSV